MNKRILIMGLPGAGKSTLAEHLKLYLEGFNRKVIWLNADKIREEYNDWDFSYEGRIRQSRRMKDLSGKIECDFAICDFVAPVIEMRDIFDADYTIWVDTLEAGRFEDTNKIFVKPEKYDFRVTEQDAEKWSEIIGKFILENRRRPVFDWKKESVQMLGRWQPWHKGHRALFERAIAKTGQVVIMVRDCQEENKNPFSYEQVKEFIRRDLDPFYQGQYEVILVPNIINITYGRDVGYKIEQEHFDTSITSISATKIRQELKSDGNKKKKFS